MCCYTLNGITCSVRKYRPSNATKFKKSSNFVHVNKLVVDNLPPLHTLADKIQLVLRMDGLEGHALVPMNMRDV